MIYDLISISEIHKKKEYKVQSNERKHFDVTWLWEGSKSFQSCFPGAVIFCSFQHDQQLLSPTYLHYFHPSFI